MTASRRDVILDQFTRQATPRLIEAQIRVGYPVAVLAARTA